MTAAPRLLLRVTLTEPSASWSFERTGAETGVTFGGDCSFVRISLESIRLISSRGEGEERIRRSDLISAAVDAVELALLPRAGLQSTR